MIPKAFITEWRNKVPWQFDYQVEQDLIIERAIISIFLDDYLREKLAFRGGTALHKLYLSPQVRYSEDIDLVQLDQESIGEILTKIRAALDFLGTPRFKSTIHNNTLIYRFTTGIEPVSTQKLKIEINTREHFALQDLHLVERKLESSWFTGSAEINTFSLEELLATKLRALYQRRKGRDLFDFWYAISNSDAKLENIISLFKEYIERENLSVSTEDFISSVDSKLENSEFVGDITGLIKPSVDYDIHEAWKVLKPLLINTF